MSISQKRPTKQQVRQYMEGLQREDKPPPDPKQFRRELGWDLIEAEHTQTRGGPGERAGYLLALLLVPVASQAADEMVKDKAWESFFTLGPLRITGAVQAIINSIAIR